MTDAFLKRLAEHGMVDSPSGHNTNQMRDLGAKNELDETEVNEVVSRASGHLAVFGFYYNTEKN